MKKNILTVKYSEKEVYYLDVDELSKKLTSSPKLEEAKIIAKELREGKEKLQRKTV